MADTEHIGRDELFYVKATVPGDASESALRLPSNYVLVGGAMTSSLDLSRNIIDANHKDSGDGQQTLVGRLSGSHSLGFGRPKDDNAGILILRDNGLISRTTLWFLRVGAIATRGVHFKAQVNSYQESDDDEAYATGSCGLTVQGVPSFFLRAT